MTATPKRSAAWAPWAFGVLLLLGWHLTVAVTGLPPLLLPGPGTVAQRLVALLAEPSTWGPIGITLAESVGGSLLGAAVALPLGILIHRNRVVNAAVTPFLGATQAIPAVAIAPLLAVWTGYGLRSIILLCALLVFFPILVATVVGLRQVDHSVLDAARMDGAEGCASLRHIELPLALASILGGVRNGVTLSVTGAVVGEMVIGGNGLGQLLSEQRANADTPGMFATIFILCALASVAYVTVHVVERRSTVLQSLSGASRNS